MPTTKTHLQWLAEHTFYVSNDSTPNHQPSYRVRTLDGDPVGASAETPEDAVAAARANPLAPP